MSSKLFLILTLIVQGCYLGNILFFSSTGSKSMCMSQWPLVEALAEKGHQITFITTLPDFKPNNSQVKIKVPQKLSQEFMKMINEDFLTNFLEKRKNVWRKLSWYDLGDFGITSCKPLYSDEEFMEWARSVKFDLVIIEAIENECAYGLIHLWKAKFILYSTTTVLPWFSDMIGLPDESSSLSDLVYLYNDKGDTVFIKRFLNAINPIIFRFIKEYSYLPALEEIAREGLGRDGLDMKSFREIERNCSLVFITTHYSIDVPWSFPPNVVPIGGIVVKEKQESLPLDMEHFIDLRDGFIYISFGSFIEFDDFDEEVQSEFIEALALFPNLGFVLKSGKEIKVGRLPENVFVTKWVDQQALLNHSKIKAFISHAGMGSVMEAMHFSVPMICLPVIAEQDYNANMVGRKNAGIVLELVGLKRKQLEDAISKIVYNEEYRTRMNEVTRIFKDRQMPPVENGVWWVEYVLRHNNINEFMASPSIHLEWWKRRQLDVWIIVGVLLLLIFIFIGFVFIKSMELFWRIFTSLTRKKEKQN